LGAVISAILNLALAPGVMNEFDYFPSDKLLNETVGLAHSACVCAFFSDPGKGGLFQRRRGCVPMIFNYMMMSMVALSALATGVVAPEFEAVSYDGRKITLSALQQQGPVMLVFLRGFS